MMIGTSPRDPTETLQATTDPAELRVMANDGEILQAAVLDAQARGVRSYANRRENLATTYGVLRKRCAIKGTTEITATKRQLARDIYPDVCKNPVLAQKKEASVVRWLRVLERRRLIETTELSSTHGKSLGLRVRLLPIPEELIDPDRPDPRLRRPGAAWGHRARSHCPAGGRGASRRFARPGRSVVRFETPGGERGFRPPLGASTSLTSPWATRGRGEGVTRTRAEPGPGGVAAPIERNGSKERGAVRSAAQGALVAACEAVFDEHLGRMARFERAIRCKPGEFPSPQPLHDPATIKRLVWVLERLDRYADFGVGREGAGLQWLAQRIEDAVGEVARRELQCPMHLGYFLPEAAAEAKRWKHTWAPRLKQQRRSAQEHPPQGESNREGTHDDDHHRDDRARLDQHRSSPRRRRTRRVHRDPARPAPMAPPAPQDPRGEEPDPRTPPSDRER